MPASGGTLAVHGNAQLLYSTHQMHPFAPTIKVSQNIRYATFTQLCTNTIPVPAFCKGDKENRHLQSRNHQTRLGQHGSRKARLQTFYQDRPGTARSFPLHLFISSMLLFAGPRKNGKASPARRARERWRIKEDGRVGGESEGGERGSEGGQGGGPVPGGSARLTWGARGRPGEQQQPEAGEQQSRAAVAGGRPAAAPPRYQRNLGAGLPLHGHASAPRHTGLSAWARSGPGRGRPLRRGLGAAHRRAARPARRGRAGPDPRTGAASTPAAPLRPLPSLAAAAGQRTAPRGEASTTSRPARLLPAGRPAEGAAGPGPRPPPGPASPEGARDGTAPHQHSTPEALEEQSETRGCWRSLVQSCPGGAGSRCVCGAAKVPGCRADKAERSRALFPGARVQERLRRGCPQFCPSVAFPELCHLAKVGLWRDLGLLP